MTALLFLPGILLLALVSCGVRAWTATANGALPLPPVPTQTRAVEADDDEGRRAETPRQAAAFYLLKRTGGAPLPVEELLAAKRHKESMQAWSIASRRPVDSRGGPGPRDANVGTWQPLGPGNMGGRTRSLVIRPDDPNTTYAGAVGGGVWKTTNGGSTWNPRGNQLSSRGSATNG